MREFVYSLATVAGFIGLASLYNHGQNVDNRVRRESGAMEMDDAESFFNSSEFEANTFDDDLSFLQSIGYLEEDADIPVEMIEDVKFYSEDGAVARAGGNKKILPSCLKNIKCRAKAQQIFADFSVQTLQYIEQNLEAYCGIVGEIIDDPNSEVGTCTPEDMVQACSDEAYDAWQESLEEHGAVTATCDENNCATKSATNLATSSGNDDSGVTVTGQSGLVSLIQEHSETSEAVRFAASINGGEIQINSPDNVFGANAQGFKTFLIQPNGIPIHDIGMYRQRYANYWNFFKYFNNKFMGIASGGKNRGNLHVWFLRADKQLKPVMRVPVKAAKSKFPWAKFDALMSKVAPTVNRPAVAPTFETVLNVVDEKNWGASHDAGNDCFVFWFHQVLPLDIPDLTMPEIQEDIIQQLDTKCTVIHIMVGMGSQLNSLDDNTQRVWQYIQGILQPSQAAQSIGDANLQGWYWVPSLNKLNPKNPDAKNLAINIYRYMAIDRVRVSCLLAKDYGGTAQERWTQLTQDATDNYDTSLWDDYDSYGTTTIDYDAYTTVGEDRNQDFDLDVQTTQAAATTTAAAADDAVVVDDSTATVTTPPAADFICCGRGPQGLPFDSSVASCCYGSEGEPNVQSGYWCAE